MVEGKAGKVVGAIIAVLALLVAGVDLYVNWEMLELMRHPTGATAPTGGFATSPLGGRIFFDLSVGLVAAIALVLNGIVWFKSRKPRVAPQTAPPSKLVIQSADYRAVAQGGRTSDVTECLQKMVRGDSLILQIENHNFVVDGKNYVPQDPFFGQVKRLSVAYYFDGGAPVVVERPEHARIVLPEDTYLSYYRPQQMAAEYRDEIRKQNTAHASELYRAQESYRQCEAEKRALAKEFGVVAQARRFTDLTPQKLLGFYKDHGGIQADKLIAPYKGLWITTSGEILLLMPDNAGFVAAIRNSEGCTIEARFPDTRFEADLAHLKKGDFLSLLGRIQDHQNGSQLYIGQCELADPAKDQAGKGSDV